MNCKQTREAIDTASRRAIYGAPVTSHLSGCLDCRRYADETHSLLMLLSAQPRVQAPADFDFRVRAGIARAQAEQANPAGLLERLWENFLSQTFSWGQAATAMAAIALVVTVSTFYINLRDQAPAASENSANLAQVMSAKPDVDPGKSSIGQAVANQAPRPTLVKFTAKPKASSPNIQNAMLDNSGVQAHIAFNSDSTLVYNAERRQVVSTPNRDTLIGVENAGLAKQATVALTF